MGNAAAERPRLANHVRETGNDDFVDNGPHKTWLDKVYYALPSPRARDRTVSTKRFRRDDYGCRVMGSPTQLQVVFTAGRR